MLRFYDFVDKNVQKEKEERDKEIKQFGELVTAGFREIDKDNSGYLDIDELKPMCMRLVQQFGSGEQEPDAGLMERMFNWLDMDGTGKVNFYEFKVQMMRAYVKQSLPEELLQ